MQYNLAEKIMKKAEEAFPTETIKLISEGTTADDRNYAIRIRTDEPSVTASMVKEYTDLTNDTGFATDEGNEIIFWAHPNRPEAYPPAEVVVEYR